jgi:hydrogenase maturation protease
MDKIGGGATMRAAANETIGNENHALRDPQPDLSGVHPSIRIHPEAGSTPVEVITIVQLTPELAEPVSQAGGVIFIDASVDGVPGEVVCCRLSAAHLRLSGPVPATTHHLTPATLLQTALLLYGQAPPAWIYTTGGATFELGETLSPAVAQAVPRTIDRILARLRDPDTPL